MKIRLGLVLMLACGLGLTGCASGGGGAASTGPSTPGGTSIAQGERPRQTENTRAAQRHLDAGDDADAPAEARPHFELALTSAMAAIAEDGRNPLAHRQAALANLALENYQGAGTHFDHAAGLRPIYEFEDEGIRERAWMDLYQVGVPLVNSGDYEEAVSIFENANAIYSDRPEAMVTLAQIHASLRNHDAALENIESALAIINSEKIADMDSTTAASWREQAEDLPTLRAQVFSDAGRFEEAAEAYRGLVATNPDDVVAARNLAGVLIQMGDEVGAFAEYEKLLARPDLRATDFYTIGVGFYTGSDYTRAAQAFEGAATRNVNDRDALEMWARSLQLDSAYMEIPAVGDRWVELDPYSQGGYLIMAQAVNQNGDEDRARELIAAIDALEVEVSDLQITRLGDGGARITGSVGNKTLDQGATVTLSFTFYTATGDVMGTLTHEVTVGGEGMKEVFEVEYTTGDEVGGYGYTLSVG
ncbi:MAG: tetratricopeptide repeat protein [Gemmatimonadetes bacterium]|nr:tetratricopeptide repeat protein [Gemmatimonadota bacterium]